MFRLGHWCEIVRDPSAYAGYSMYLFPDHNEWAIQWRFNLSRFEPDIAYDVYARVRVEPRGNEGYAFTAGIWDFEHGSRGAIAVKLADLPDSDWHLYKLGTIVPTAGQYVWCAPPNNAENVAGVWLDYFELQAARGREATSDRSTVERLLEDGPK
jgi:hypothetical protein